MLIDCETCVVRDLECGDCVVTHLLATPPALPGPTESVHGPVLLGLVTPVAPVASVTPLGPVAPVGPVRLEDEEAAALQVLADYGLVPPLRLAQGE